MIWSGKDTQMKDIGKILVSRQSSLSMPFSKAKLWHTRENLEATYPSEFSWDHLYKLDNIFNRSNLISSVTTSLFYNSQVPKTVNHSSRKDRFSHENASHFVLSLLSWEMDN